MMVVGQVVQRLDRRSDALVLVEKTENPYQHRIGGQIVEHRKALPRGGGTNGLDFGSPEKGKRVVEDMPDAIEAGCIVAVATVVNDCADLLSALCPAQRAG